MLIARDDEIAMKFVMLMEHYENLPEKLQRDGVCPSVPWLYGYKLDFRFR